MANNMENNENGFFNAEPQKPITEKETTAPETAEPAAEESAAGGTPKSAAPEESYTPQQNSYAPRQEGFAPQQSPFSPPRQSYPNQGYPQNGYPQNGYQGYGSQPQNYPYPRGGQEQIYTYDPRDRSASFSNERLDNSGYYRDDYAAPYQSAPNQGYTPQPAPRRNYPQGYTPAPYGYSAQGYGDIHPAEPAKKKSNAGLIAVIIILSLLLVGSLAGILTYIASGAKSRNSGNNDNENGFVLTLPDDRQKETFPNILDPETEPENEPETTAPVHDESDYSDKINKDYKGLEVSSKPADAQTNSKYNSEYAYSQVSEAVVGVLCYTEKPGDDTTISSQGSGIIISSDGYLITNAHVIGNSKNAYIIKIRMLDGKEYSAGVVGFDSRTDLALLKLDGAKNLKAASFGNSKEVELGEDIIVVGNPGGINYQNSITKGIVSALDRDASSKSIVKYIQTDAAINPGNSGGPLVNMYGQVIGIASSKIVSEQYEGMGFAIPADTAKTIIDSLMKRGYVEGRVKIGISGMALTSDEAQQYGVPQGIIIQEIQSGGPCDGTALRQDDIITEADGQKITSFSEIYSVLENHKPGDKITLKYFRPETMTEDKVEVTLQEDK